MNIFKKIWPYLLALVLFEVVACIYMSPDLDGNKTILSSDGSQWRASANEILEYFEATGEDTWWTNSMFGGMPTYQIGGGGHYASGPWLNPIRKLAKWNFGEFIRYIFLFLVGAFVLMRAMKVNVWLSIVGALAIAFSSYFFIIIGAGHFSKHSTLAWMTFVIGGFFLIFNKHRRLGTIITMLCTAAGFYYHPQMSYYICFILGFCFLAELAKAWKEKAWKTLGINTLIFAAAFIIGVGTGTSDTFVNLEYSNETMRGGHSDLVKESDGENKTKGLDLDYATSWSYGIDECMTFLVPNFMGGSSNYSLGKDSQLYQDMVKQGIQKRSAEQFCQNVPTYWGDQPFTAGPVYMGAIICFLFVLSLMLVKGPYKWALLAVTVLAVLLSWGYHFIWFTKLFFNLVPMYNKFRAVSSILVIAEITMPLLGFLALKQISDDLKAGTLNKILVRKAIYVAAGVTGGLCLILALFGSSLCTFTSDHDASIFQQLPEWLVDGIVAQRAAMLTSDAWRSLCFIILGAGLVWFYSLGKLKTQWFALILGILVMADMWPVNKRFMNDSHFTKAENYDNQFKMKPYEKQILDSDKDPNFRIFDLTTSPFNDARPSYYLKNVGGYHAAKLRRYQDLIDQHLSKIHLPVLNMLNTKYLITQDKESGEAVAQRNPGAMGNAWFVENIVIAETANEECDKLMTEDLTKTAIVGKDFAGFVKDTTPGADSTASVKLTHYAPIHLDYDVECAKPGTIVFSEIYYPHGWKATIDGEPVEHYRANYTLRAINVDAGSHHIRFDFDPDSVKKGNYLSMTFIILMYLIIIGIIISSPVPYFKKYDKKI